MDHKAELKRLLTKAGHRPSDFIRIESAGDSGLGVQEILFLEGDKPMRALIDKPNLKAERTIEILEGWGV